MAGLTLPARALRIPCVVARGGTSRGMLVRRDDLPAERELWDLIFLAAIGSPDVRQIDGLGAGDSHTSKVAVLERAPNVDVDVDYLFGEVAIDEPRVDYRGNSGNLISAVGLYAVEQGWVEGVAPHTTVRVRNVNTQKMTEVRVPVADGRPAEDGDFVIDGVPGFGPRIDLVFPDPEGAVTGRLFPAGATCSQLDVPALGGVEATLIDAANPAVLVAGAAVGATVDADIRALNADSDFLERMQQLRAAASAAMGLVAHPRDAWRYSPMLPFVVLVFPPAGYPRFDEPRGRVHADAVDLCVRVISLGKVHKSINVTMCVAVAAAAACPGTVAERLRRETTTSGRLRIGHPSGVVETRAVVELADDMPAVRSVSLARTARIIMAGELVVPPYKLRYLERLRRAGGV